MAAFILQVQFADSAIWVSVNSITTEGEKWCMYTLILCFFIITFFAIVLLVIDAKSLDQRRGAIVLKRKYF